MTGRIAPDASDRHGAIGGIERGMAAEEGSKMATFVCVSKKGGSLIGIIDGSAFRKMCEGDGPPDGLQFTRIKVRRVSPDGVAHVATMRADEIRCELAKEIASALGGGETEIGGQRYRW